MKSFEFEVHCSTKIIIEGDNREEARTSLVDTLKDHTDEIINGDCYIDDGREVK